MKKEKADLRQTASGECCLDLITDVHKSCGIEEAGLFTAPPSPPCIPKPDPQPTKYKIPKLKSNQQWGSVSAPCSPQAQLTQPGGRALSQRVTRDQLEAQARAEQQRANFYRAIPDHDYCSRSPLYSVDKNANEVKPPKPVQVGHNNYELIYWTPMRHVFNV